MIISFISFICDGFQLLILVIEFILLVELIISVIKFIIKLNKHPDKTLYQLRIEVLRSYE